MIALLGIFRVVKYLCSCLSQSSLSRMILPIVVSISMVVKNKLHSWDLIEFVGFANDTFCSDHISESVGGYVLFSLH
jgi:hypothetical protein